MRGGISYTPKRYSKANNEYMIIKNQVYITFRWTEIIYMDGNDSISVLSKWLNLKENVKLVIICCQIIVVRL